jgi:hypothetical protein
MYCSSCGVECAAGLSYCNRCGANLNPSVLTTQVVQNVSLTKPIVALSVTTLGITLGGLTLVFLAASEMASHSDREPVMAILVLGILTIFVTSVLLIRQLSRVINATLQPKVVAPVQPQPAQFAPAERTARQIASAPQDYIVPSVTEHTTRTLAPSYKEPHA